MKKEEPPKGETAQGEKPKMFGPSTIAMIADLYGVSIPTMKKMIKPHWKKIGKRIGNLFTTRQILVIFKCIGPPTIVLPW